MFCQCVCVLQQTMWLTACGCNECQRSAGHCPTKQAGRQAGRQAGILTDNKEGKKAGGQAGRQTDRQTGRQAGRQTNTQKGREAGRQAGKQADRQTDRKAGRLTHKKEGKQAGRQAGRQTNSPKGREKSRQASKRSADRQAGRQAGRQAVKQEGRQGEDRQPESAYRRVSRPQSLQSKAPYLQRIQWQHSWLCVGLSAPPTLHKSFVGSTSGTKVNQGLSLDLSLNPKCCQSLVHCSLDVLPGSGLRQP